jgi:hypothetical protein
MPNARKPQVEAWWQVLESEKGKPEQEQSRFLLGPLTQAERMRVWDDSSWLTVDKDGNKAISARGFQQAHALLLSKLLEVRNFPLDGPKPWPTTGSRGEKESYLELLNDMDVFELGNAVRERSTLEQEAKNS